MLGQRTPTVISTVTQASAHDNWQPDVQALWDQGRRQAALDLLLQRINATQPAVPRLLGLQLVYYVYSLGDLPGTECFLRQLLRVHPNDPEMLENLAVVAGLQGRHEEAVTLFERVLALAGDAVPANVWDGLTTSLPKLERYDEARSAGERALAQKTAAAQPLPGWRPPAITPRRHLERPGQERRRDVISFSLWGGNPRYLRGALRNALLIPELYPGWQARFHLDDSVPEEFRALLEQLGADCRLMPAGQSLRQRLCWRFLVANDPQVGRFLVRDCDAVVNQREVAAVQAWLDSDCWFHVMRDWWTHADPLLAGMWGGVAGVLPELAPLLAGYRPAAKETANVDQWFLRDVLWGSIRPLALIHDRCFRSEGSQPWPTATPDGHYHVGQNEFAVRRQEQAIWLAGWLQRMPCLQIQGEDLTAWGTAVEKTERMVNIDLRRIQTVWISMQENSASSQRMRTMLRQSGFGNVRWSPGVSVSADGPVAKERLHAAGVALAHQKALLSHTSNEPLLVLEDDVELEADAQFEFQIPHGADAVWTGISRYGKPILKDCGSKVLKVQRMFSTHAVLYLSRSYLRHAIECINQCLDCNLPFDIALAFYQKDFEVYALNPPVFYQSLNNQGSHNFEDLTRGPIL